jgi:hypothetical protein
MKQQNIRMLKRNQPNPPMDDILFPVLGVSKEAAKALSILQSSTQSI